jgi:predicted dithiol-disulfide oxidoreductase (DUF899 family)
VSSLGNDFRDDFGAAFTDAEHHSGVKYNFRHEETVEPQRGNERLLPGGRSRPARRRDRFQQRSLPAHPHGAPAAEATYSRLPSIRRTEAVRPIPGTVGIVVGPVADDHDRASIEVGEFSGAA